MGTFAKEALKLFYQKFGRRIIKTAAESKWLANTIRLLKQKAHKPKTSDVVKKVREGLRADRPFQGFKPTIVPKGVRPRVVKPKTKIDFIRKGNEDIKNIAEGMKPKKGIVNIGDRIIKQMQKEGKTVKFDDLLRIYGKKPPTLKADGGSVDKALPKKSRDI